MPLPAPVLALSLLLGLTAAQQPEAGAPVARQPAPTLMNFNTKQQEPQFCVIVRTYWGHSGSEQQGLRRLIRSLRRQSVQRCGGGGEAGGRLLLHPHPCSLKSRHVLAGWRA